jgi:ATP-dependent HslUV protease ATP-binding subunit HslU
MGSAVQMTRKELAEQRRSQVEQQVENRLLDLLLPGKTQAKSGSDNSALVDATEETREKFRQFLREGRLEEREIEITVSPKAPTHGVELLAGGNLEDLESTIQSLGSIFGNKGKKRKVTVKRAREILTEEETERSLDQDQVIEIAKERVEQMGIIFIDEIDKVAGNKGGQHGPDVSREGVQRDILPIVEGSQISTKWGIIDTTHILFIAAGAFHVSKPSDLIPELQGRFPLRVELNELTDTDFLRILQEPENAIVKQYIALMKTEEVSLVFTDEALKRISQIAYQVNSTTENIGARRLYTIMERLLDDISFNASEMAGQTVTVDDAYVEERLATIVEHEDLSRYIL